MRRLRQSANRILKKLNCQKQELSLLLVDNEQIQEINKKYLNRNYPTNVIAFSQTEGEFGHLHHGIMGDIVISAERASSDAMEEGLPFDDELDFLLIHGILHLTGYNHEDATDAEINAMKNKAEELFFFLKGYRIG